MFTINLYCFYWSNFKIVKELENLVNFNLVKKLKEELIDDDATVIRKLKMKLNVHIPE